MIKDIFRGILNKIVKTIKENIVLTIIIVVVVFGGAGVYFYSSLHGGFKIGGNKVLKAEVAGQKAIDYINNEILQGQGAVSLKGVTEESGMYKIKIAFESGGQTQESDAYLSKDGRYLFPIMQGFPIDLDQKTGTSAANAASNEITSCQDMPKSDKPVLEAFVVSQCPYGLQMERLLTKTIEEAAVLASNIKVRYLGSVSNEKITSMHGDAEAQENLRQICIREEQSDKYWDYLSCYMKAGETDNCLTSALVNKTNLNACMSDPNKGLKYAQEDFTLANEFNIRGSPTLLLGNSIISEFSFGGRTAEAAKEIICCASNSQPSVCSVELSKLTAAVGFSQSYSSGSASDSTGGCE